MLVYGKCEVSSCSCCMLVACVHPMSVLNAAFCITFRLFMLVEDARGDHMAPNDTAYKQLSSHGGYKLPCKLC